MFLSSTTSSLPAAGQPASPECPSECARSPLDLTTGRYPFGGTGLLYKQKTALANAQAEINLGSELVAVEIDNLFRFGLENEFVADVYPMLSVEPTWHEKRVWLGISEKIKLFLGLDDDGYRIRIFPKSMQLMMLVKNDG